MAIIRQTISNSFKLLNASWKGYCAVKMAEQTGMTYPEILYYKDVVKGCTNAIKYYCKFYSKNISLFIKQEREIHKATKALKQTQEVSQPNLVIAVAENVNKGTLGVA